MTLGDVSKVICSWKMWVLGAGLLGSAPPVYIILPDLTCASNHGPHGAGTQLSSRLAGDWPRLVIATHQTGGIFRLMIIHV